MFARRCYFRQRVLVEVWNDSVVARPIAVVTDGAQFAECVRVDTDCHSFESFPRWVTRVRSHTLRFRRSLFHVAQRAFVHAVRRYVLGVCDRGGGGRLNSIFVVNGPSAHTEVSARRQQAGTIDYRMLGLRVSDGGLAECEPPPTFAAGGATTLLQLLSGGGRWNQHSTDAMAAVFAGGTRCDSLPALRRMDDAERWQRIDQVALEHGVRIDTMIMRQRLQAVIGAVEAARIV